MERRKQSGEVKGKTTEETLSGSPGHGPTCTPASSGKLALAVTGVPGAVRCQPWSDRYASQVGVLSMALAHGLSCFWKDLFSNRNSHTNKQQQNTRPHSPTKVVLWFLLQTQDRPCRNKHCRAWGTEPDQEDCCSLN